MNKKHLIIVLAALFIIPLFGNQVCAQNSIKESIFDDIRFIDFETTTEITIDNKETSFPIIKNPGESENKIKATVRFKFETPSYFPTFLIGTKIGKWIIFRDVDHDMSVNLSLSVVEKPDWVDIDIPKQVKIENIGNNFKENSFEFNITFNKTAVALQEKEIKIKAVFTPHSSWGLKSSENYTNFNVKTNYFGEIYAGFNLSQNTTVVRFEAGQTKNIKLGIFNHYNAKTIVHIEPSEEITNNKIWNLTLEQNEITLNIGEYKEITVNITAKKSDSYKNKETVFEDKILKLTPKAYDDQTIQKTPLVVKSPSLVAKGESTLIVDIMLMVVYALIAIVVIALVLIVIIKKLKR